VTPRGEPPADGRSRGFGSTVPKPAGDDWRPRGGIDVTTPHPARVYDFLLGGKNNCPADREVGEQIIAAYPEMPVLARENRRFLTRAVRYAAGQGIRQFLDVGAGFPTSPNTHEVARRVAPQARVVYVDNDRVVVAHGRALLADQHTSVISADLREPQTILHHPDLRAVIDLTEPVAILLVAILHFIRDEDDPYGIVETLIDAIAPGSYLILSHGSTDFVTPDEAAEGARIYDQAAAPLLLRTRAQIHRFVNRLEPVDPGLVQLPLWRPDRALPPNLARISAYATVAHKPR
jgi:hypothetical protein